MLYGFFKKWHRWISLFVAVPFSITLVTGLLMSTRAFNTWVQPDYPEFKANLNINFAEILQIAQNIPEAKIISWSDVSQIDVRPANGNIRVRSKHDMWEIQINGETKQVTNSGKRRQSFLISLHEGAYWGPVVRYGLFLSSSVGVFLLLVSGLFLAFKHYSFKFKKK